MNKLMKNLRIYNEKPNTLSKGTLYIGSVKINGIDEKEERKVRIYLPSNYCKCNKYPVIYMLDGKNLFDKYTSFMGEWGVDEIIEELIEENKKSYIVVGIDSDPTELGRIEEMLPSANNTTLIDNLPEKLNAKGEILGNWIVNELKSNIDKLLSTLPEKENTVICGSSMGGLFSFYMGVKYKNTFGKVGAFSPAFCLYENDYFKEELKKMKTLNLGKMYLLVGNIEYENQFIHLTEYTYNFLNQKGLEKANLKYIHDLNGIHHESFWNKYFKDFLEF